MFFIRKSFYVKSPNSRTYRKLDSYRYFDKTHKEVCDYQYNMFEKGNKNKPKVTYSNFGSKRIAIRTFPNGGKMKTIIEEVYSKK